MPRFSQTDYALGTDPSTRAANLDRLDALAAGLAEGDISAARIALLDRIALIAAGGAGELTPARVALLDNLDVAVSVLKRAAAFSSYVSVASDEASGTISIDSGQLAAGDYEIIALQNREQAAGSSYQLQHRNAANSANVKKAALAGINLYGHTFLWWPRTTLALNERIRIANQNIGGGGSFVDLGLFVRLAV